MTSDTYTIEKQIVLRAPRSRVWRALTNSGEFTQWFGMALDEPFLPGTVVHGRSTNPDWAHLPFEVTVDRMEPEHTFAWRWHPGMPGPGEDFSAEPLTTVVFTLEDVPEGTLLRVFETGFDALPDPRRNPAFEMNIEGWTYQFESLRRYVENGGA